MKERVTVRLGTENVILVAPHGHDLDDTNTGVLALATAKQLDGHAIVNNGWKRGDKVDEIKGIANCNNNKHCAFPVVKAEFLDPILQAVNTCQLQSSDDPIIFMIHGVGDSIRKKANDPKLDLIVGFGDGNPPALTCEIWQKDFFIDGATHFSFKTYAGKAGGDYSARSGANMTQWLHRNTACNVIQLEFVHSRRKDTKTSQDTGNLLALVISGLLKNNAYSRPPNSPPHLEI